MKKTFTINLGEQVFHIDDDAYERLQNYLIMLERHFGNDSDKAEIISDIEFRMAELFKHNLKANKEIINLSDVEEVIKTLGKPEEIGEEPQAKFDSHHENRTTYRRMYRDTENKKIAGVCSGVSAYFSIDPLLLRIVFLVLFFGYGVGFILYIILWIVLPEAITTAQKLEMRGEPITITNIGKTIRDEFDNVTKRK